MSNTDAPQPWQLGERELLDDVGAVSAQMDLLEARRVALVAEIDRRVSPEVLGYSDPKNWLLAITLLGPAHASRILTLARGIDDFPDIADAFSTGRISLGHAVMILEFGPDPPTNLPEAAADIARRALLAAADGPGADTRKIRAAITHLRESYGNDTPPAEDTERNELFASRTANGRLALKADLDAITGEKLLTALSPLAAPTPATEGGDRDLRTPARRRADALAHILDHYLATRDRPTEGGDRPHLNLHIRADHLAAKPTAHRCAGSPGDGAGEQDQRSTADPRVTDIIDDEMTRATTSSTPDRGAYTDLFGDGTVVGWLPWMGPLTRTTSRQLACDCTLTPIILDEHANPIDLGRTVRTVTAEQKRALIARDQGCAFPAAANRPPGPRHITSSTGSTVDPATSTTSCFSARFTTGSCTTPTGRSSWAATATPGSPRREQSTPPARPSLPTRGPDHTSHRSNRLQDNSIRLRSASRLRSVRGAGAR